MKKLNNKGFTLIELLAVITIMGILMLVAIPSVSRVIENSRRDSFAETAGEYLKAVRNGVLADNISCTVGSNTMVASATPDGTYYFTIDTTQPNTKDLMESGGKSPFGSAEMQGYVKWVKTTTALADGSNKTTTTYTIMLSDTGKHGLAKGGKNPTELKEEELKRANVITDLSKEADTTVTGANVHACVLS